MMNQLIKQWHQIVKTKDTQRLMQLLADDVVFHSPVMHKAQKGRAITSQYLSAALSVLLNDTFRYVREVTDSENAMLEFEVEIDGILVNGIDMIKINSHGKICDFKVMLRPLKGINLIHQKMADMLQKKLS